MVAIEAALLTLVAYRFAACDINVTPVGARPQATRQPATVAACRPRRSHTLSRIPRLGAHGRVHAEGIASQMRPRRASREDSRSRMADTGATLRQLASPQLSHTASSVSFWCAWAIPIE